MGVQSDPSGMILAGRYRVLDRVAAGGMGTIYTGEHVELGHRVAIKLLRAEAANDPKKAERFRREARASAQIDHENVVHCIDIGVTDDGLLFYVMEWLRGEDLQSVLRKQRRLPWPRARAIVLQVCRALAAAHSRGIIHRDLKPSNLFLIRRGDTTDFVKVVDFGIAKHLVGETVSGALTTAGELIGTIAYMAPEQAAGDPIDARTDVYATGVILFQMLTGRVPYPSKKAREVVTALLTATPPRLCEADPLLVTSPALEALIQQVLHRDPEQRPVDMMALHHALQQLPEDACVRREPAEIGVTGSLTQSIVDAASAGSGPAFTGTAMANQVLSAPTVAEALPVAPARAATPATGTAPGTAATPARAATPATGTAPRTTATPARAATPTTAATPATGIAPATAATLATAAALAESEPLAVTEIRPPRRRRGRALPLALIGGAAVGAVLWFMWPAPSPEAPAVVARVEAGSAAAPAESSPAGAATTAEPAAPRVGAVDAVKTGPAYVPAGATKLAKAGAADEVKTGPADEDEDEADDEKTEKRTSFASVMKGLRGRVRRCLAGQGIAEGARVRFEVAIEARTGRISGAFAQPPFAGRAGLGACVVEAARGEAVRPAPANEQRRSYEFSA